MKRLDLIPLACILTVLGLGSAALAAATVDPYGSVSSVGRLAGDNLLSSPIQVRIVVRQFQGATSKPTAPTEVGKKIVVENQASVLQGVTLQPVSRVPRLVIDDVNIGFDGLSRNGPVTVIRKHDRVAELDWETQVRSTSAGGIITITFKNRANRLRSLDVEMPVVLPGGDYQAFFPGQNDFPDFPAGGSLAYGLRYADPDYNTLSQPMGAFYSKSRNVGITLAADYTFPILPITFYAAKSDYRTAILVTFPRVRLDPRGKRTITLHLAAHEGDWRCALAYALETWPDKFKGNPETAKFFTPTYGGSASLGNYYPYCFATPEFWENYDWKRNPLHKSVLEMMGLERWFGQYVSDVPTWTSSVDAKWFDINKNPGWYPKGFLDGKPAADAPYPEIIKWIESRPESMFKEIMQKGQREGKFPPTSIWQKASYDKVREFIRVSQEHGSSMFLYWNPRDVWYPYAKEHFKDLIVTRIEDYFGMDNAICNPARGSKFYKYQVGQVERMFKEFPKLDGFFIDQGYGTANSLGYDDGCTVRDDGKVASDLNFSLADLTAAAAKIAHKHGKWVWSNHCHETIDIVGNSDLALCEDRESPGMGQEIARYCQIGGRPCVNLQQGEPVDQVSLRNGVVPGLVPMAADDYNTRLKSDVYWINRLYAPMFDLFRYRTWCLEPHCLTLPDGFEGNLFRIDKEQNLLATVVAFGESFASPWTRFDVPVIVRASDAKDVRAAYVIGAANLGTYKVPFERSGDTITVRIPRFKGSAAVLLAKKGHFVSMEADFVPPVAGGTTTCTIVADNLTDQPWSWKCTGWVGDEREWYWEEIAPWASVKKSLNVAVPAGFARPFTQVMLAKNVPSRLPADESADHHFATFELPVEGAVTASLSPGRALAARTVSNSDQDGYKPFYQIHTVYLYEGETGELDLGIANHQSTAATFEISVTGEGAEVVQPPAAVTLQPREQRSVRITIRGTKRGASTVHATVAQDGKAVAQSELSLAVFGRFLAEADLPRVKELSMLYDIWGSSPTDGANAKRITLNGVRVGNLRGSGGWPTWIRLVRAKLDDAARGALKAQNTITLGNPTGGFWKLRNPFLEVTLDDGSIVHLSGGSGSWSSPATNPWAEGTRLTPGTPAEMVFGGGGGK